MKRTRVKQLFLNKESFEKQEITICGWVRTNRSQAQFGFLNVNDGSFFDSLQVVYDNKLVNFEEVSKYRVGSSVEVTGIVVLTPEMKQPLELHAKSVKSAKKTHKRIFERSCSFKTKNKFILSCI